MLLVFAGVQLLLLGVSVLVLLLYPCLPLRLVLLQQRCALSPYNSYAMNSYYACCLQDPKKRHELERAAVREVICALCKLRQPAGPDCAGCGTAFGAYTCMRCCFFDDDLSKKQFHCDFCGICRVGGRENFFHCHTCGCCYSTGLQVGSPS